MKTNEDYGVIPADLGVIAHTATKLADDWTKPYRIVLRLVENKYVTHLETFAPDGITHDGFHWGQYFGDDYHAGLEGFLRRAREEDLEVLTIGPDHVPTVAKAGKKSATPLLDSIAPKR